MSSASQRIKDKAHWISLAIVALCAIMVFRAETRNAASAPISIGQAQGEPLDARSVEGGWLWREQRPKGTGRLVRASAEGLKEIAAADTISSFDTDGKMIAWTAQKDSAWSVMSANADGTGAHPIWSGKEEPMGVKLAQDRVYWLRPPPSAASIALPFPPLQPNLQIVSAPVGGGAVDIVATLPESDSGNVLGLHENALYVRVVRMNSPGATALYKVNTQDKSFARIVSVPLHLSALLTRDGTLYWLAPSAETDSPAVAMQVFRLNAAGEKEPLSDWLPSEGVLYETAKGVVFADRELPANFWRVGSRDLFPVTLPLPEGYTALAPGDTRALLFPVTSSRSKPAIYEMPLP